jgi:hypothetical protein
MWYIEEEDHSDEEAKGFDLALEWQSPTKGGRRPSRSLHSPGLERDEKVPFSVKVLDASRGISLFGTVPPPKKVSVSMQDTADAVGKQLSEIEPDGVVIYDIQDEPSRSGEKRPFPFFPTYGPRDYGQMLQPHLARGTELVIFRSLVPGETEQEFKDWAETSINEFNVNNWVIVGGQRTELPMLSVEEASGYMSKAGRNVILGGITLPERHRDKNDEPHRISNKVAMGVSFFTSQVVYNVDNVIWFLQVRAQFLSLKCVCMNAFIRFFFFFCIMRAGLRGLLPRDEDQAGPHCVHVRTFRLRAHCQVHAVAGHRDPNRHSEARAEQEEDE